MCHTQNGRSPRTDQPIRRYFRLSNPLLNITVASRCSSPHNAELTCFDTVRSQTQILFTYELHLMNESPQTTETRTIGCGCYYRSGVGRDCCCRVCRSFASFECVESREDNGANEKDRRQNTEHSGQHRRARFGLRRLAEISHNTRGRRFVSESEKGRTQVFRPFLD